MTNLLDSITVELKEANLYQIAKDTQNYIERRLRQPFYAIDNISSDAPRYMSGNLDKVKNMLLYNDSFYRHSDDCDRTMAPSITRCAAAISHVRKVLEQQTEDIMDQCGAYGTNADLMFTALHELTSIEAELDDLDQRITRTVITPGNFPF